MKRILIASLILGATALAEAQRERHFNIDYDVFVNKLPTLSDRVDIWIPLPHSDAYQSISRLTIESTYHYKITTDHYGNKILFLHINKAQAPVKMPGPFVPPPQLTDSLRVNVQYYVKRREHIRVTTGGTHETKDDADPNMARWLEPDRLVPLDDKIRGWAKEVVDAAGAKTDLEKARAIYNHVVSTVKYDKTGKGWGRGDIYYACDARRGNCTDFHAMFIGYARALGIPARFSVGLPLPKERGMGSIAGYHCWAEFYIKGMGWIPVDASEASKDPSMREYFFGAHDENRVEVSRGRDLILAPKQQSDPVNFFVYPLVEVDGKPYTRVELRFRFGDITKH